MERLIVLDTETTGIEPSEGHRIIEIGCTEIIDRAITEGNEYHQYIQPERNVGDSVRIHGITDKFLTGKPKFEEIASEFIEYIRGATLVIHNAPFDLGFLINAIQEAYYLYAKNPSKDTTLINIAKAIGLNVTQFKKDLNSKTTQQQLDNNINLSKSLGAKGFPSIILEKDSVAKLIKIDYNNSDFILKQILT